MAPAEEDGATSTPPRRTSMAHVTQRDCDAIARRLNTRPS
jgi:hypothetical protein